MGGGRVELGLWGGGNSTLRVGLGAGWLGEGAHRFRLCACACVILLVFVCLCVFFCKMVKSVRKCKCM